MNRAGIVALTPLSGLYGVAMKARRALYRNALLQAHRVGAPVISVGNITMGGTGKTPLVEWIAREYARRKRRVCVLTRGHGRQHPGNRLVVSNGKEILADASVTGDEPLVLAENLKELAVVICDADRVSAARWGIDNLGSDLFILDDGFQHLRLARDFDLAIVDATNPWGNRRLLPAGILREPPAQLARANCIVITRADDLKRTDALEAEIEKLSKARPVFRSQMRIRRVRKLWEPETNIDGEELRSIPIAAFCGIGNPDAFFAQLRRDGYQLRHTKAFSDHHIYAQADIDRLADESTTRGAQVLLTTAKDEVKLRTLEFKVPCYVVDIEIEIESEEKLLAIIGEAIGM